MSTHGAPAQRVPAWKRLGLKLKGAASGESPAAGGDASTSIATNNPTPPAHHQTGSSAYVNGASSSREPTNGFKRKQPPYTTGANAHAVSSQTPNKRLRRDDQAWSPATGGNATVQRLEKSVSFAEGTKDSDKASTEQGVDDSKSPKKNKKKKTKKVKATKPESSEIFSLEPALSYLRQWDTDRGSWKFNKNHQTLLIKYVFDPDRIPSADIAVFYKYIRDLKGSIRSRLRETAADIKKKDMEQGAAGFPESTKDKEDKEKEYEEVLAQFIRAQQGSGSASGGTNANGKRSFDEVEFVLRTISPEAKQRVIKRMRAELVLGELSDSEQSTTSSEATSTSTATVTSSAARENAETQREKRVKLNDGSQKVKRRRLRNVRTEAVGSDDDSSDDSSSDESDSGESSVSSSSGSSSSSEDSEDEEMPLVPDENGLEESSSSSSSSSSSAESESESESGSGSDESGAAVEAEEDSEESDDE